MNAPTLPEQVHRTVVSAVLAARPDITEGQEATPPDPVLPRAPLDEQTDHPRKPWSSHGQAGVRRATWDLAPSSPQALILALIVVNLRTLSSWTLLLAPAVAVYFLVPSPDVAQTGWALGALVITFVLGNFAPAVYHTRKQAP